MSYLDGWQLATIKLDAKCGKGWKSGAGGKCVRNKISKKKVALGAVALGGLAATGTAAMMMANKKRKKKGESTDEEEYAELVSWSDVAKEYDEAIKEAQAEDPSYNAPTFREASEYYGKKLEEYNDESKWTDPEEGQRNLNRWAKEHDEFYKKAGAIYEERRKNKKSK